MSNNIMNNVTDAALFPVKLTGKVINLVAEPLLSPFALRLVKGMLPPVSATEQVALDGVDLNDRPWSNETVDGKMSWGKLYALQPKISKEAQDFLDNETEKLCEMLDDWQIREDNDMPEEIWDFMGKNKFFGMVISKEEGGLGFNALEHSEVVKKIGTRSPAAAVNVMVPNSLGPGELLHRYGTEEQKEKYLHKLATGEMLPCFGLTSPNKGSDAAEPDTTGELFEKEDGSLGIRINGDKRYITLAPRADLVGVAFSLKIAPELQDKLVQQGKGHVVEQVKKIPTTVALVERGTEGMGIGKRHNPGSPFLNGPIEFKDCEIDAGQIVGGLDMAGQGWKMLMECLGVGRAISLPTVSSAAAEKATMTTSAYTAARVQFGLPVGKFDGVKTVLGEMAGLTYMIEAGRRVGSEMVDAGINTTTLSAMTKSESTEMQRTVVNHAMDLQAGKAIQDGKGNLVKSLYEAVPVGVTVEGANLLTKNLVIAGQGLTQSHKYARKIMDAATNNDKHQVWDLGLSAVGELLGKAKNSVFLSMTDGRGTGTDGVKVAPELKRAHQQVNRMAAAFGIAADCAMFHMGGALKRKEDTTRDLGGAWTMINYAAMTMKHWDEQGRNKEDLPLVNWAVQHCLHNAEESLKSVIANYPSNDLSGKGVSGFVKALPNFLLGKAVKGFMKAATNLGDDYPKPLYRFNHKVAELVTNDTDTRKRLFEDVFVSSNQNDPVTKLETGFKIVADPAYQKLAREALKNGTDGMSDEQKEVLAYGESLRNDIVAVDSFENKYSAVCNAGSQCCPS